MCGIAGAITTGPIDEGRLQRALAVMRRRGPDGEGIYRGSLRGHSLTLLHSRLAIVDLDDRSRQPFEADGCVLVFNGEIYNYIELRAELESLGHRFRTSGDTEVIVQAYRAWGADCVDRFEGMWAFALYDSKADSLLLSRDRFGEKPLFVWTVDGAVYFGSEVKFLSVLRGAKPDVNMAQIRRYMVNGYKALYKKPQTFFDGVYELPSASNAVLTEPSAPVPRPYWQLRYDPQPMSREDALAGARERVFRAVELRLRADVPVAVRLSGGIDSNVICGVAAKRLGIDTTSFSVVEDDPRYDETGNILKTIDYHGLPHELVRIPQTGFLDRLRSMIDYFDAPVVAISYYLHTLVSEAIHEAGLKVSLGGTGADELFTGYYDHYLFWLAEMRALNGTRNFDQLVADWRESYGRWVRNPHLQDPLAFVEHPGQRDHIFLRADEFAGYLTKDFDEGFDEDDYCDAPLRNRMLNEVLRETVPPMLHDDDMNAMYFSVENRAPYLDRRLAEFLFTVPSEHLIQDGLPKFLLRATGEGLAPEDILRNPRKQGINAPITSFVDFTDPDVRAALLSDSPFFEVVRRDRFAALLESEIALNSESKFLFYAVSAKTFLETQRAFQP